MTSAEPFVLVCDDERDIRDLLCDYLSTRGFRTKGCADADELLRAVERAPADLAILDINMPGMDGLTALRTLRMKHDIPVIMLTAASETIDRVLGLELGADDYLGKPFDLREVEARAKSVLRRRLPQAPNGEAPPQQRVVFGDNALDLVSARLFDGEGNEVAITAMEFALLKVFAANRGRVLNRDQLLEQAHDRSWDPFDRSIDLRISRLRQKIERNPKKPEVIRTVRGLGYIYG
ncbi:response regulator [Novosphingobium mangrovi (ex Huang et al. 2023)]|uniref:Response regulator n=1 Tax=Novosphingobium mangrovi (ex Huang et al. 2023) TaxID=2976432 RepID=A0ABT2I8L8_9SPHN|nr:response regulator [Novosphingobium mangrovi (ex Huang et al. 2023)]MCT2401175.1 response regulator [Novosphingobium mangrovi (ex Huang et al. 2023)]